jgi:hypothetical protein
MTNLSGQPWNKGKLTGQKPPLKLKEIWAIRIRLQIAMRHRDLAIFNLAIDSKLRSCDLVKIRVRDVTHGATVAKRAIVPANRFNSKLPRKPGNQFWNGSTGPN